MSEEKKSDCFIRRLYKENDSIVVEDSNGDVVIEEYSDERYLQLKKQMIDSLKYFDITSLKDEIFEGKLRRFIMIIIGVFGLTLSHFNIVILLATTALTAAHELYLHDTIKIKKAYDSSKYLLKYEELFNNKINNSDELKAYVNHINQKSNRSSINDWQINELQTLREKILEEAGLVESPSRPKIFKKIKK
ncbi:MAG: hypothetical protein V8Q75_01105 [Bacilli bacterium]